MIETWREGSDSELVFPPDMGAKERKFVHNLAAKLGLKSKSRGKGEKRFLTVSRKESSSGMHQIIDPSVAASKTILQYYSVYPLEEDEISRSSRPPLARESRRKGLRGKERPRSSRGRQIRHGNRGRISTAHLPVTKYRQKILDTIEGAQVTIVSGQTGTGKSTQVPRFILDHLPDCNIICTQPRRISAIGLANRVADEIGEAVGETVGYAIRLERSCGPATRLLFCTTGILLRRMMDDPTLERVSHVVIDEVHERDSATDFLLVLIRDLVRIRPGIKIVLMSATISVSKFADYFDRCPVVDVPGRTFPVRSLHLENVLGFVGFAEYEGNSSSKGSVTAATPSRFSKSARLDRYVCPGCRAIFPNPAAFGVHSLMCFADAAEPISDDEVSDSTDREDAKVCEEQVGIDERPAKKLLGAVRDASDDTQDFPHVSADALQRYQERCDDESVDVALISSVIGHLYDAMDGSPDGAVLVFLPGWADIVKLTDMLAEHPELGDEQRCRVCQLHSMVPTSMQKQCFAIPPGGVWKIVISTNIAETSITISDVVYVIDAGKAKKRLFDPYSNLSTFLPSWISKASCKQRAGRAGRCRQGICFRMYSRARYDSFEDFELPEILRVPLDEIFLQTTELLSCRIAHTGSRRRLTSNDVVGFLSAALDAPSPQSLQNALAALVEMGAFTPSEDGAFQLSVVGSTMAKLPLPPRLSKMLLLSVLFRCVDQVLTIVCATAYRNPFVLPMGAKEKREALRAVQRFAGSSRSDHIALLNAYNEWSHARRRGGRSAANRFCYSNFLSPQTMGSIYGMRGQLEQHLRRHGILQGAMSRAHKNSHLIRAIVCAGLYPNVAVRQPGSCHFSCRGERKVRVHLNSANASSEKNSTGDLEWLVFQQCTRGLSRVSLESTTFVSPFAMVLFCGDLSVKETAVSPAATEEGPKKYALLKINDQIAFHLDVQMAPRLRCLRTRLQEVLWAFCLNPRQKLSENHRACIDAIASLATSEW